MKLVMLGCGTSTGVPRIGGPDGEDWGDCDPNEPRNRRSRSSVLIENKAGARLLIDTSTDLRAQLLAARVARIDAVFWTHDHADHCHGIDDLRPLRYGRGGPIPAYGSDETVRRLRQRFGYVFAGEFGYPSICTLETVERLRICQGFGFAACQMPHGPTESTGFRFDCDDMSIGYAVDFSAITADMLEIFGEVDLLVIDCLRREPHPTHAHLTMALELASRCGARRAILTHLDKSMDYQSLSRDLPPGVEVGFDGLEVML